jgi:protein SCO1/2
MKRKYSYIGLSLIILVFGIIFIPKIVETVGNNQVVKADRLNIKGAKKEVNDNKPLSFIEINGKRKKAPKFELVNQDGDTITNDDYLGKVYVAEFFFTTCPTICPIMNQNLVEVQNEFKNNKDFGIASFTIDPNHDTPKVLKSYAENYGINHPNWNLLTGDKDAIYGLANAGFNVYVGENSEVPGGFAHQGLFALVDKEGYIRSRVDKYGNPIIYYRGSVERSKSVAEGEEVPQIEILIEDIRKLL